MIWYSLLQVIAILCIIGKNDTLRFSSWEEKALFCLLVLVPIVPIIFSVCYYIYKAIKK